MKKIYILSTCSTCKRILEELGSENFDEIIDIKKTPVSAKTIDEAASQLGNYEALFNKRAIKYKPLKGTITSDRGFRKLLLSDYTFLKRPLYYIDGKYYTGNSKKTVEEVKQKITVHQ